MSKYFKTLTFWNLLFILSVLFILINIFTGNTENNYYNLLVMLLSVGFDRIEKILKGKNWQN